MKFYKNDARICYKREPYLSFRVLSVMCFIKLYIIQWVPGSFYLMRNLASSLFLSFAYHRVILQAWNTKEFITDILQWKRAMSCDKTIFTWTLSPSRHICGGSTILRSGPTSIVLSINWVLTTWPPMWCGCSAELLFSGVLQRNTVKVTSPFRMSKSQVITQPRCGTWSNTCV